MYSSMNFVAVFCASERIYASLIGLLFSTGDDNAFGLGSDTCLELALGLFKVSDFAVANPLAISGFAKFTLGIRYRVLNNRTEFVIRFFIILNFIIQPFTHLTITIIYLYQINL
jgi:hypothetical protein